MRSPDEDKTRDLPRKVLRHPWEKYHHASWGLHHNPQGKQGATHLQYSFLLGLFFFSSACLVESTPQLSHPTHTLLLNYDSPNFKTHRCDAITSKTPFRIYHTKQQWRKKLVSTRSTRHRHEDEDTQDALHDGHSDMMGQKANRPRRMARTKRVNIHLSPRDENAKVLKSDKQQRQ